METKLCFDDILLLPKYSELESRTTPDISVMIGGILKLRIPIISAPMDSITGKEMVLAMDEMGGLGILSRHPGLPEDQELYRQCADLLWAKDCGAKNMGCAIGIRNNVYDKAARILDTGCNVLCVDVAHGDHKKMYESLREINKLRGRFSFVLMAGNVCIPEAAQHFASEGVNAIKVGIGPGAVCTTRAKTGFGMPQLAAITECTHATRAYNISIIADGGLRASGDMVKALWGGASACMVGFMLAGTDKTPDIEGQKIYRGMSSRSVSGRADIAPEGIEIHIEYTGRTEDKVLEYSNGIRSGLAMGGAHNIEELRNCDYIRVSPLSIKESSPYLGVSHASGFRD